MVENIHWLGHDGFKITGERVMYLDPWQLGGRPEPADLVLITHEHYDHCSPEDIAKVQKADTVIVTTPAAAQNLKGNIRTVKPGDVLEAAGVPIEVVAAYNINKFRSPGVPFHPQADGKVGFIFTVNNQRICHAGDTDLIPEMDKVKADIALIPVSGTYVMTVEEALQAVDRIKPKLAIPMHYGTIVGSEADAQRFKQMASVPVEVLKKE